MRGEAVRTLVTTAAAVAFFALAGIASAGEAQNYTDATGDSGPAPDYTGLTIDNDDEGNLVFGTHVSFDSRTNFEENDLYIIHIDADRNPETGGLDGAEYEIVANLVGATGQVASEARSWDGTNWVHLETPLDVGYSTGPFFILVLADFGLDYGDTFDAVIRAGLGINQDVAPDANSDPPAPWSFTITRTPTCGIEGTADGEALIGTFEADYICGFRGDDDIRGLEGRDRLVGGPGEDLVIGGPGKDRISGGPGEDVLRGNSGADRILGGKGEDRIKAGRGADRIYVEDGEEDSVRCGRGNDVIVRADSYDRLIGC